MAELEFFPEQKKVLESVGKNMLISASAGSGKTTITIEYIAKLIIEGKAKLDQLLILTFTNASATDMKQKLHAKLKSSSSPFLENALEDLPTAEISTIDSFCQRLLKRNFHILGLDPSFRILDEAEKALLQKKAMNKALNYFKENRPDDYLTLLKCYGKDRTDKNIINLVYKLANFLETVDNKELFKENALKMYDNKMISYKILNDWICDNIHFQLNCYEKFYQRATELNSEEDKQYLIDIILQLKQIEYKKIFFDNLEFALNLKIKTHKPKQHEDEEFNKQLKTQKEKIDHFITSIKNKNLGNAETMEESFKFGKNLLKIFFEIVEKFSQEYKEIKINSYDYSDVMQLCLELLKNQNVKKSLTEHFEYIFVDEFQDINDIQQKLIEQICRPNNRFLVGDVKQSIYRFRWAKPQNFLFHQKNFENDPKSINLSLNMNHRSDGKILEFVNYVFKTIMTKKNSGIDYLNESMLKPNPKNIFPKNNLPKVTINVIEKTKDAEKIVLDNVYSVKEHQFFDGELKDAEKEAIRVKEDIFKFKDLTITQNGIKRAVKFSDMTILVKKRGANFEAFCSKLIRLGVPIYANSSDSLFKEVEVQKLIALLKLSQNFYDDLSLAMVMHSLIGNFSLEELSEIRLLGENEEKTFFYNCVLNYQKQDKLKQKIDNFIKLIEDFTNNLALCGVYFALETILKTTSYTMKILPLFDGELKLASIEKFKNLFLNSSFNFDITSFLRYYEIENKEIQAPDFYLGENDFVNVTTIHSSKGLEFPIVFLVGCGNDFSKVKYDAEIEINDQLGIGLKYVDEDNKKFSSPVYESIKIKNQDEEFAETIRLLYVAMTRAQFYLNIYGITDILEIKNFENEHEIRFQKTYLNLILGSLSKDEIKNLRTQKEFNFIDNSGDFAIRNFNSFEDIEEKSEILFGTGTPELEKIFENISNNETKISQIALKNSVSSLATEEDFASINLEPKNLTLQEHLEFNHETTEMGILYHKVFEILDFEITKTESDVLKQLEGKIEKENFSLLESKKILNCVTILNKFLNGQNYLKEKKFMMFVPYNSLCGGEINDKILVQGIIDLFSLGEKNILVDYKLTSETREEKIKERYSKQIALYKKALMLGYNLKEKEIESYILLINNGKLIKID